MATRRAMIGNLQNNVLQPAMAKVDIIRLLGQPDRTLPASAVHNPMPDAAEILYYEIDVGEAFDSAYFVVGIAASGKMVASQVFEN